MTSDAGGDIGGKAAMADGGSPPGKTDAMGPGRTYLVGREGTAGQGPFMLLALEVRGGRVVDARFQTYPCPAAAACGEFVAGWVTGKTLAGAAALDGALIESSIGKMPLGREHCPVLAVKALREALAQAQTLPAETLPAGMVPAEAVAADAAGPSGGSVTV
ncbi:MAG: iron-sulfur cluster assembly scaffold protein [Armatimonadetes bacterium]|nr:iron-sulfur cluster assembly scaffold protein [Armatimonadota bacterium]